MVYMYTCMVYMLICMVYAYILKYMHATTVLSFPFFLIVGVTIAKHSHTYECVYATPFMHSAYRFFREKLHLLVLHLRFTHGSSLKPALTIDRSYCSRNFIILKSICLFYYSTYNINNFYNISDHFWICGFKTRNQIYTDF